MFDQYIAMDPALWFNEQYLVKNFDSLTKDNDYTHTKLWFAGSSARDINPYTNQLKQKIEKQASSLTFMYTDKPMEKHNTIFRATKEEALIWTFSQN